ncbi:MAG TPA: hypothetical protein VM260_18660 [Pirellula sp.]|nr:hypothetical protein [Pirellula sp.]
MAQVKLPFLTRHSLQSKAREMNFESRQCRGVPLLSHSLGAMVVAATYLSLCVASYSKTLHTMENCQADPICRGALTNHDVDAAWSALPSIHYFRFPDAGHRLHRNRADAMLVALKIFFDTLSGTI